MLTNKYKRKNDGLRLFLNLSFHLSVLLTIIKNDYSKKVVANVTNLVIRNLYNCGK